MMELINRKKLDIVVEAHGLSAVEQMLASVGVKGWSVFAGVEGAGIHGPWRQTSVDPAAEMRLVMAIMSADASVGALQWLAKYFSDYPGIVSVSDVQVLRGERF